MNCESMEALIAGYLANDASPEERRHVEDHLLECGACRAEFATAKAGWEAARALRVPALSSDVDGRVKLAIAAQGGRALAFFKAGTGIAAGIILALALFMGMPKGRQGSTAPAPDVLATVTPPASIGALYCVDPETKRPVGELSIQKLSVTVEILDGVAQTTVEEVFFNETDQRLEGTFRFPLPPDASITRLAMEIDGKLMEGECVERQKARQTYEGIVRRMKDPALLEWMPGGLFSCRIFPIEAKSPKRIIIGYQQALSAFDGRFQYVYPLVGETTREKAIGQFAFTAFVKGSSPVAVSSTSHGMQVTKKDEKTATASFEVTALRAKTDVVLAIETETPEAVLVAHRTGEQGAFNLFIAPKADAAEAARSAAGTVFVVDCSASMTDPEMDVARRAVEKLVDALAGGTVQVIGANVTTSAMPAAVELKEKRDAIRFLFDLKAGGALDLAMALRAAMTVVPDGGEIVFVGEGTPSLGESEAAKIVASAREAAGRKQVTLRAVAVGTDADRTTLEAVARAFNGGVHAISPSDDVNARLAQIARTVGRAAMTDVKVEFEGATDIAPASLGSVYFGERTMVSGRYAGASLKAVMTGSVHGRVVRREWSFDLPAEEKGNLWVRRLWAQRRVADLMAKGEAAKEEITKIGVAYQLMTPYTSFLVLENEKAYEEHSIERTKKVDEKLVAASGQGVVKTDDDVARVNPFSFTPSVVRKSGDVQTLEELDPLWRAGALSGNPAIGSSGAYSSHLALGIDSGATWAFRLPMAGEGRYGDFPGPDVRLGSLDGALTGATFGFEPTFHEIGPGLLGDGYLGSARSAGYDGTFSFVPEMSDVPNIRNLFGRRDRWAEGDLGGFRSKEDMQRQLDGDVTKVIADIDVYTRQMELQRAQMQDVTQKLEDYRAKLARANASSNTAMQELQYARLEVERLSKDLASYEEAYIELARGRKSREETIAMLNARGVDTSNAPPLKAIDGKVTACDDSIGMVVISIGRDDGVLEGNEFTVYRGGNFVAKITINKVDRRWAAGRVTLKKEAPRVGDDASNQIFVTTPARDAAFKLTDEAIAAMVARKQRREVDTKAVATWHALLQLKARAEARK